MDKRFYLSKKFWTAVITAGAAIALYATNKPELATLITAVGSTLIVGIGLTDLGKAKG